MTDRTGGQNMSLINKLFGGNSDKTERENSKANTDSSKQAGQSSGKTEPDVESGRAVTTEESAKIYEFARTNASEEKTAEIFGMREADSYYIDSEEAKTFSERIMEFGFDNPLELEEYLNRLWKDDEKMQELIPIIKVAVFKNRDKYDSKYKDLSLYNYTL